MQVRASVTSPARSSISASGSSSVGSAPALCSSRNSRAPSTSPAASAARARIARAVAVERVEADERLAARPAPRQADPFSSRSSCSALKRVLGFLLFTHLLERLRGRQPGVEIRGVEGAQANDDLRRAAAIAAGPPLRRDRRQVRLGVGEQPLHSPRRRRAGSGYASSLRDDLQDLLVERRGLGVEALGRRNARRCAVYCADGLRRLARPDVEVAERVGGVPVARMVLDHAKVFRDRQIEATLAKQLLRLLQRVHRGRGPTGISTAGVTIATAPLHGRQSSFSPSYQTGMAAGTTAGARPSSRTARPRRGARVSRSPCADRSRSADRGRAAPASADPASPWRRSTRPRSPCSGCRRGSTGRCAISRSGIRNASTSTKSGHGTSASTAAASPAATPDGC